MLKTGSFLTFNGTANDVFDNVKIESELILKEFPILNYFGKHDIGLFINGKGDIRGNVDTLSIAGDFRMNAGKNINSLFSGKASIKNIFKNYRTITADAKLIDHHLRYSHPLVS